MSLHDDYDTFQRVRFFDGMLLTADDLKTLQEYSQNKNRRHNRCFHGSRVACGLEVNLRRNYVYIYPGLALDCCGREIVVSKTKKISLPKRKRQFFLTISYAEFEINAIPFYLPDCDEDSQEFSRIQESFKTGWSMKDPLSNHDWHDGAWVTCGKCHPIAIAKFIYKDGRIILDKLFNEKISAGRHNW